MTFAPVRLRTRRTGATDVTIAASPGDHRDHGLAHGTMYGAGCDVLFYILGRKALM